MYIIVVMVMMTVTRKRRGTGMVACKAFPSSVLFHCIWVASNEVGGRSPHQNPRWLLAIIFPLLSAASRGAFREVGEGGEVGWEIGAQIIILLRLHCGSIHHTSQMGWKALFVGANRTQRFTTSPLLPPTGKM